MRFSGWRFCALVSLVSVMGLFYAQRAPHAESTTALAKKNKVIIYPSASETIEQLRKQGLDKVDDYGSYWLVEVNEQDLLKVKASYGDRAVQQDDLNRIELRNMTIDTTGGEPGVPFRLQQTETKGRRLRLIQFKGPVFPKWLDQVKAIENLEVIHYVPYNAYLIYLNAATEKKLNALREPNGPIQWIGAYHPYYKLSWGLQHADGLIDVDVAAVDTPEGRSALERVRTLANSSALAPLQILSQGVIKARVDAASLGAIACMPEVLWISQIIPIRPMDEVQALLSASRTNALPGHSPLSGDNYLTFLTNVVGGGLASFTDPETYPIVDIADSGFTPVASFFGADFGGISGGHAVSRVAYRAQDFSCGPFAISESTFSISNPSPPPATTNVPCTGKVTRDAFDDALAFAHGTAIASIIAGGNTTVKDPSGFNFGLGISPFGLIGSVRVFEPRVFVDDAPTCSYHINDFFCNTDLPNLILNQYLRGGRISNNSWDEGLVVGVNDGVYNARCQTYDIGVRDASLTGGGTGRFPLNQELIVVFANGNTGNHGNTGGGAGGFGDTTLTSPTSAKNVISVGATKSVRLDGSACPFDSFLRVDNSFDIAQYSSFGPTRDGRFKPEIVAPDTTIYAMAGNFWLNNGALPIPGVTVGFEGNGKAPSNVRVPIAGGLYVCGSGDNSYNIEVPDPTPIEGVRGTSFAAPAVSGGIQLLWWYFQNRLNMLQPSPAMAKAYLLNSARYLPIAHVDTNGLVALDALPSMDQGMGMMDLRRMFDGVPRVIRDQSAPRALDTPLIATNIVVQQTYFTSTDQSFEWTGQVASNGLPFRVTLAWTDAPGDPANDIQLVNDLNLEVTIGGLLYRGNNFVGSNSVTGCVNPQNCPDHLNNTESVFLDPGPGAVASVTSGAPWKVVVRAKNIAGDGVPHVGTGTDQDFAIVIYNSKLDSTLSDLPNPNTNDTCQTAHVISSFPFSVILTNFPGTAFHNTHPSPTAGTGGANGFWKLAIPTQGTVVNVDTAGSTFNTVLSVWRGDCGSLIEEVSDKNGSISSLTFTADGSNDYYIVAEGLNNAGGNLKLNVAAVAAPVFFIPASLDFGSVFLGATSSVMSAVLTNGTTQTLTIDTTVLGGADPGDFVIVEESCAGNVLAPGGICTVSFQFVPTALGSRTAQLAANDNAIGTPQLLQLSGNGLPPSPAICLSSSTLTFSNQAVGTSSVAQSVVLTNCGTAILAMSNVFLTGSASNDFSIVQNCANSVFAPGAICTNSVTFTPLAAGLRQATLTIQATNGALTTVSIQGTGFVPVPAVCLSASTLAFGAQGVGTTSTPLSVTITNCGTSNLTVTAAGIAGANAGEFHITTNLCSSVATGATCSISVDFTPTTGGVRTASLAISNNASGSPHLVSLTGSGSESKPDAAIGKTTKAKKMIGAGVFSSTGVGEEFVQRAKKFNFAKPLGTKHGQKFFVTLKNAGSSADRFMVEGDGDSAGFRVKYFLGATDTTDITAAVEAGTFSSSTMAPGAITDNTSLIRIEVFADKAVPKRTVKTFLLKFTSVSDPTKIDVVKATVTVN